MITLQIAESVEMDPGDGFNSTPFPGVGEFSLIGSWEGRREGTCICVGHF